MLEPVVLSTFQFASFSGQSWFYSVSIGQLARSGGMLQMYLSSGLHSSSTRSLEVSIRGVVSADSCGSYSMRAQSG